MEVNICTMRKRGVEICTIVASGLHDNDFIFFFLFSFLKRNPDTIMNKKLNEFESQCINEREIE